MGQEQSGQVGDDVPPQTLSARNLAAVADLIKNGGASQIAVLTGAGISTAAGIPDFRSPHTGLYANLQRLNLPSAESVFDIGYFRQNPDPFYVLAKELYPGKFHPTVSHVFISLLAQKGFLRMLFTQNIDCLERRAGVPDELIVEAHGSFATQRCIDCKAPFPDEEMKQHVQRGEVPRCSTCTGLVKPDIVFFGEQLPLRYFQHKEVPATVDLVLILGTSLSVQPFASLPTKPPDHVPRVLFNLERVGGIGNRADDVLVLGSCDDGIRQLADELGWRDELEAEWRRIVGGEEADRQLADAEKRGQVMEHEVARLADEVDEVLRLGEGADTDGSGWDQETQETQEMPAPEVEHVHLLPGQPTLEQRVQEALFARSPALRAWNNHGRLNGLRAADGSSHDDDSVSADNWSVQQQNPDSESGSESQERSTLPEPLPPRKDKRISASGLTASGGERWSGGIESEPVSLQQQQQPEFIGEKKGSPSGREKERGLHPGAVASTGGGGLGTSEANPTVPGSEAEASVYDEAETEAKATL